MSFQSEPEKQDENKISEKNFHNLSASDLKYYNPLDFEKKFFKTRHVLK